jgi:hypothetical protein
LEIVIDIMRKAADKVGKTGEREWKDVLEQQSYVIEEVTKLPYNNFNKGQFKQNNKV